MIFAEFKLSELWCRVPEVHVAAEFWNQLHISLVLICVRVRWFKCFLYADTTFSYFNFEKTKCIMIPKLQYRISFVYFPSLQPHVEVDFVYKGEKNVS